MRMAAARNGWGITRKASENIEFTYKWAIEEFDFAMGVEKDGKVESPRQGWNSVHFSLKS